MHERQFNSDTLLPTICVCVWRRNCVDKKKDRDKKYMCVEEKKMEKKKRKREERNVWIKKKYRDKGKIK